MRSTANDIVFGVGPAGTGKTYLAMAQAVAYLVNKKVSRIILARPAVEAGEKLGFLPGDLQEKVNPYLRPLYDALYDMLDVERVARYLERGTIEIAPIAFMRGRTLNDSFVILDEAQNTTSEQMKMFLTRLGFGSKAVITGDITQIDLPTGRHLGPHRGHQGGRRDRGHFVRPFRRTRRGSPQARAADRQGVRRLFQWKRGSAANGRRAAFRLASWLQATNVAHAGVLQVSASDEGGRPLRGSLARWLSAVAPARARGSVTVAVVTDARVRALNRQYRKKDYATDVLSFPAGNRGGQVRLTARVRRASEVRIRYLGDIVIARGVARRQARGRGPSPSRPNCACSRLHGLLHLLGYDHEARQPARWRASRGGCAARAGCARG